MIFLAKGWTLGQWPSKRQDSEMQSLVTLVGDVTLLAPLSYLPLPPLHNTFFTIKTCHLYSYGDIFCTWRKNEAFLFTRMTLFWLSATAPTLETTGMYKKSCSSMSFINLIIFYESIPCSVTLYIKKSLWHKIERKKWNSAFCITGTLCQCMRQPPWHI